MNFEEQDVQVDGNGQSQNISQDQQKNIQSQVLRKKATKTIRFDLIVRFFQKMSTLRGVKKGNYCRQFLKAVFKSNRQPSFVYSILRILLPSDDRDRGNYGLKQKGIAKVISECLGLKKQDYERLYHYKNPNYHQRGFGIGDFSLCVFDIARNFCKQRSELTVMELNILMDQLALSNGNYNTVFRQLFQKCNAEQIKWIIRIVLKDLKLSIKLESVLNTYHKDAYDYFNLTNSIFQVCKKFQNHNVSLDDQVNLFNPIRPMLAGKKNISYFKHHDRELLLQTKYDGERIQAHFDGKEIKLFSRNGVNYSHVYKQIIDVLMGNIQADACILDGQVIVLQKNTLGMVPFGMNKVVALSNDQSDMQLCYKVFDIMWVKIEGEQMNMMKFSLNQRKKILQNAVKQVKGKLQLVKYKRISQFDQILREFGRSIQQNEQGIMLKDPNSLYLPKERGASWLKLKGDYIQGLTDTMDLIIIGGFFGDKSYRQGDSNHWVDKVTTFALGLIDHNDQEQKVTVYPFCKVGTGYDARELSLLRERLKQNLVLEDGKFYPKHLKSWKYSIQDKPDCWVKTLQKSILLQVKAAQIIDSDSYPTNATLRFPRVVKVRYDKDWNQGATMKQLQQMRDNKKYTKNMKKIKHQSGSEEQNEQKIQGQHNTKKVKTQKQSLNNDKKKLKNILLDDFCCVQLGQNDVKKSNLFYGLQFVVFPLNNKSITRHDIQREVLLHGGRVSQNPLEKTNYIVADHIDFRLSLYQSQKHKDISFIKPKYVYSCIGQQKILTITPLYLTCLPQGKRKYYNQNFDRFSDSYTAFVNEKQLEQIMGDMPEQVNYPVNEKLTKIIGVTHRRQDKRSVCIGVKRLDIIKLKSHGNKIFQSLDTNQQIDSIVVDGELKQYQKRQLGKYLDVYPETVIEYVEDLRSINIL